MYGSDELDFNLLVTGNIHIDILEILMAWCIKCTIYITYTIIIIAFSNLIQEDIFTIFIHVNADKV